MLTLAVVAVVVYHQKQRRGRDRRRIVAHKPWLARRLCLDPVQIVVQLVREILVHVLFARLVRIRAHAFARLARRSSRRVRWRAQKANRLQIRAARLPEIGYFVEFSSRSPLQIRIRVNKIRIAARRGRRRRRLVVKLPLKRSAIGIIRRNGRRGQI